MSALGISLYLFMVLTKSLFMSAVKLTISPSNKDFVFWDILGFWTIVLTISFICFCLPSMLDLSPGVWAAFM